MDPYSHIGWLFRNLWKIFSVLVILSIITVKYIKSPSWFDILTLFFTLEGTALLSSAFSLPVADLAADGGLKKFIINCLQYDYPVNFNPVLFFFGILSLFVGNILTSFS